MKCNTLPALESIPEGHSRFFLPLPVLPEDRWDLWAEHEIGHFKFALENLFSTEVQVC